MGLIAGKLFQRESISVRHLSIYVLLYFLIRGVRLMDMPIFIDEATFFHLADQVIQNPLRPFATLNHGHQPLHSWFLIPPMLLFSDPLLAGRLVSLFAGFATLMGLAGIARFYSLTIGRHLILLSFLFSPLFLLHDRLAIKDSLVAAQAVWFFYCLLRWLQGLSIKWMIGAAVVLGMGLLTKSIAIFFVLLAPLSLLTVEKKSFSWRRFFPQTFLLGLTAFAMHSVLRLSKGYERIDAHTATHLLPLGDFLQNPFTLFWENAQTVLGWLNIYLGAIVIAALLASILILFRRRKGLTTLLLSWITIPPVVETVVGHDLFPRYILFTLPFWFLLLGLALEEVVREKKWGWLLIGLLVFQPLLLSAKILTDLPHAPIAAIDRWQYLESWPSGYGFKESVAFFRQQPSPCTVLTETTYLTFLGLPLYLKNSHCKVKAVEDGGFQDIPGLRLRHPGEGVFLVLNYRQRNPDPEWFAELAAYPKAGGKESMRIFKFVR